MTMTEFDPDQLEADLENVLGSLFEPMQFEWHSTSIEAGQAILMFEANDGKTYALTLPSQITDGTPARLVEAG